MFYVIITTNILTVFHCRFDFGKFTSAVGDVKQGLEGRLNQWAEYEGSMDRLLAWLTECENALKNYTSLNTLEEKQEQLNKYQVLVHIRTCCNSLIRVLCDIFKAVLPVFSSCSHTEQTAENRMIFVWYLTYHICFCKHFV